MASNPPANQSQGSASHAIKVLFEEPAKVSVKNPTMDSPTESVKALLQVTLAYSPAPRIVYELVLELPAGAKLRDALVASAVDVRFSDLQTAATVEWGVWGRKANLAQTLHDQDRVEAYRPLRVDPKVARRERFAKQGARTSGLFAKRRPGAKPGY